jgi:hypothetical protein
VGGGIEAEAEGASPAGACTLGRGHGRIPTGCGRT